MKSYIITYDSYERLQELIPRLPHENLQYIGQVVMELMPDEVEGLIGAGFTVEEDHVEIKPCGISIPIMADFATPPPCFTYYNLFDTHYEGFKGEGVKVALLETGCSDAVAAAIPGIIRTNYTDSPTLADVETWHGSAACMVVAQRKSLTPPYHQLDYGIAPACELHMMKVWGDSGASMSSPFLRAINDCISLGIHIINISFGLGGGLDTALKAAMNAGIIVVCAAGNDPAMQVMHPANVPGVIAVNSYFTGSGTNHIGSYLTPSGNAKIDIMNLSYGAWEVKAGGTSQAAWMTTAILAIYKQKFPSLNQEKAKRLLQRRAQQVNGYTYNQSGGTRDTMLNYQTGAGYVGPIN